MTGSWRALLRLLTVQGAWNYERMQGVGMGYAAEPLLEELARTNPVRHGDALVRSADFFNAHPYLAGLALGATVRAEYDGAPGEQIARLRTALCGPLGALGDQLFWAGVVPAMAGLALSLVALGAGLAVIGALVLVYAALRVATGAWALRTGLNAGLQVGAAIEASWLPRAVRVAGPAAGFAVGIAVPVAATWLLKGEPGDRLMLAGAVAALGLAAVWFSRGRLHAVTYGLIALGAAAIWRWPG
jgi:PTS system mannose-specific IID component